MKEIYLQKNNRSGGGSRPLKAAVYALLLALIFVGILYFLPNFSNSLGTFFAKPLWSARNFVGNQLGFVGQMFRPRASLVEENAELKTALERYRADLLFYGILESEHQKLLEAFGRGEASSRRLAVILAKPPQSPYDTIILDIGELAGIKVGAQIFGFGNIALGQVSSVSSKNSTATLFSNGGFESHGIVERSDLAVILSGTGGGGFEARVPQDADILPDDIIFLPGQSPSPLGKVVSVESTPASSFKFVRVSSIVNLNQTRWVEVDTEIGGEVTPAEPTE